MDPELIFKKIEEEWASENYKQGNYDKIIDLYTELINTGAKEYMISILQNRALKYYYYRNDFDKAIEDYTKALELSFRDGEFSDIIEIYNGIGDLYFDLKNYEKAITEFNSALKFYSSLSDNELRKLVPQPLNETYLNLGNSHYKIGNYILALDYYNKGEIRNNNSDLFIGRSLCYLKLNKINLALKDFDKIIDLTYHQASSWSNKKDFKLFIVNLTKIINRDNSKERFLEIYSRGIYYFCLQEYDSAIEDFDVAIAFNHFFIPSYFFKGLSYLFLKKYDLFVKNFDIVTSHFPEYKDRYTENEIKYAKEENISLKDFFNYRGEGYYEMKNNKLAILNYLISLDYSLNLILEKNNICYIESETSAQIKLQHKKINELDSEQYFIWNKNFDIDKKLELAMVNKLKLDDYKKKFEDYLSVFWNLKYFKLRLIDYCIKFFPDNSKIYIFSALRNLQFENYSEAINDCKMATDLNPSMKEGYHNAAIAYYKLEKHNDSLFQINRALEIDNKDYNQFYTRGLIFLKLNKYAQSIIDFNTSIELNQNIAEVYIERAYAHIKLKNINNGIEDLKKALSLDSNMRENVEYLCQQEEIPFPFFKEEKERSRNIPSSVRNAVWKRAEGKCEICGSQEDLEFDHIIPFSKGGASTYRNIQLLCITCNRKKYNNIG